MRIIQTENHLDRQLQHEDQQVAYVEYTGSYPGASPHGNQKKKKKKIGKYIRTSNIIDKAPKKVYTDIILNGDICNGPRDCKQVANQAYNLKKSQKMAGSYDGKLSNFADHVQCVMQLVHSHPFVQQVIHSKERVLLRATQHDVESSSTCIITRTHLPLIVNYMLISILWVYQRDLLIRTHLLIIC